MPTYHFINREHTLAFRDNRCIAWDPRTNAPATVQHASTEDELKIWRQSGSPSPTQITTGLLVPPGLSRQKLEKIEKSHDMELLGTYVQFEDVETALPNANDVAALKTQVQALANIVGTLIRRPRT